MPAAKQHRIERFWKKVNKRGPRLPSMRTRCWVWTACRNSEGYGRFNLDGRIRNAHQVSLEMHMDRPLFRGEFALHTCDNTSCVNPGHLYVGTKQDNAVDRERRGRGNHPTGERHGRYTHPGQTRGEKNGRSKLNPDVVRDIRLSYLRGSRKIDLAREHGVSDAVINSIVQRKSWAHVE